MLPAMARHGMAFDATRTASGVAWPTARLGVWQFPAPVVRLAGAGGRPVVLTDFNLLTALGGQPADAAGRDRLRASTLDAYRSAYAAAAGSNRAPLVVAGNFNDWAGGALTDAALQFMAEACRQPGTVCATYSEAVAWLQMQDPAVLERWRRLPAAGA